MTYKQLIFLFMILFFLPLVFNFSPINAQRTKSSLSVGEQKNAEKGLKDNRYFFYFINSSLSNFGNKRDKDVFKEAIQRDMIAQLLYMKFLFHDSYVEIRRSQKILIALYKNVIKRETIQSKKLLNNFAPRVIGSKNERAKRYLRLGYRDVAVSKQEMIMADHLKESLYSMRLHKYVKAIKKAKHGKRYAFLSVLQIKKDKEKKILKKKYKKITIKEKFLALEKQIESIDPKKKDYYKQIHNDNYYLTYNNNSIYDQVWLNPKLKEIADYKKYLNKD